ncbi:glucose-6-phosphate dehydrogenase [Bacillus spizizenii ATCC 6633 = JCM 2499]|uniref:Glucose-6-phosphate 1-dehydrogenase n=2 Tax=Bacillus spizizenii TaxID=96241 RepID=E0U2R0_BACSH|nr:glucose-6-phosphate dehydrogenase [Bacillus spizizenii]KFI03380.1 glucose-6-phosphate dehydrogenase [Bacillus sp. BSC154]MDU7577048.1 glucose-6-phosphate dehydrogenase [Bacillus subtilis]ADM38395.1 glucose-6-phosphate 1-dehydrogenase [Bacillus spizizenii str. W23]AJW83970.1 glucose-6-phosphate dehydrogenase [Bacillus spizizenii]EFG90556.1 glucose-6-phosphate 1-dehydrogenase [Bacillus spizizenii ATCC 6633 = JCM 2499]
MKTNQQPKAVIVIFGATGDLAKRKLYPSIHRLYQNGQIGEEFAVVGVGRRPWSNEDLRQTVKTSISSSADKHIDDFTSHFYYHPFDVTNPGSYQELNVLLNQLEDTYQIPNNRMFYLAMAPEFFGTIAKTLKSEGVTATTGWSRLVIEKPFGHDLPSAQALNKEIREAFTEDQIYRIDHYLGKQMVQNIEVIRFANAIFEPLWTNRYISNIQITSSESLGVEDRARYYEKSGALRDMVQNHIMQMVALLAMEPPIKLNTEEIRSEKVKVLRALRPIAKDEVDEYFVRGQYQAGEIDGVPVPAYTDEDNVAPDSNTETFVAGKLLIDNFRWAGVPFYIRTGKRMKEKSTKIVVQFKDIPMNLYYGNENNMNPNLLVIHIQPDEGITLYLNAKKLGGAAHAQPIKLDYCSNCNDELNTPEAYEKLIHDCLLGDATNFAHWDEVALSWNFVDSISETWAANKILSPNYESGSMGPKESDDLLAKDGLHWWNI